MLHSTTTGESTSSTASSSTVKLPDVLHTYSDVKSDHEKDDSEHISRAKIIEKYKNMKKANMNSEFTNVEDAYQTLKIFSSCEIDSSNVNGYLMMLTDATKSCDEYLNNHKSFRWTIQGRSRVNFAKALKKDLELFRKNLSTQMDRITGNSTYTDLNKVNFHMYKTYDELCRINAEELKIAFTAKKLKEVGFSLKQLKAAGFTAIELYDAGFTAPQLKAAGFTVSEICSCSNQISPSFLSLIGFNLKEIIGSGCFTLKQIITNRFNATRLKGAGLTATDLKAAECTALELKVAGFTAIELHDAGFTATDLKVAGFTAIELHDAGFTDIELKGAGFTDIELHDAGFTDIELKGAGFTDIELKVAVLTVKQLREHYGLSDDQIRCLYNTIRRLVDSRIDVFTFNPTSLKRTIRVYFNDQIEKPDPKYPPKSPETIIDILKEIWGIYMVKNEDVDLKQIDFEGLKEYADTILNI